MFVRGTKTLSLRAFALGTAAASALLTAGTASAQIGLDVNNPPELKRRGASPNHPFTPTNKEVLLDLNIEYVDGVIYNPATGVDDQVRLRSYTQDGLPLPERFVSPTIVARPGDTVRVKLNNKLPATTTSYDPGCTIAPGADHNVPHCFNGTNLHTHGLWVNPSGNGDNVLLSINPGVSFEYEYAIDPEHPAGTFWYHTHRHGSTALQVSSGMAGALIIKGDKLPTATKNGDVDTLLAGITNTRERTLIFQQIQYGCFDSNQDIKVRTAPLPGGGQRVRSWVCEAGDVGGIETYSDKNGVGFGTFSSWGQSARYTSINGHVIPTFQIKQNAVERWRMIHGGVRDTLRVIFVKANSPIDLKPGKDLEPENMEEFTDLVCGRVTTPFHLVAADGLTMPRAMFTRNATFQPGYRWDAMVQFPQEGDYCMLDILSQASESVGGNIPPGVRLLGVVRVQPDPAAVNRGTFNEQIIDAAKKTMPSEVRDSVVADLSNGLKLTRFTPHETVATSELSGGQELTFDIQQQPTQTLFMVANQLIGSPGYNPQPYNPARLDRKLTLGTAEEWKLTSNGAGHPFHIHVNPFEIVSIVRNSNPSVDVSAPGAFDGGDPQYVGLKGLWKDTLWVKPGYTVKVRTRYKRYIGDFVLHCHILDHEDMGMMQNVAVVLPGGTSASVNGPLADPHGVH
jgi:FtsP/CotA-like multicopper oxidase with cupredoxin domain